MTLAPLDDMRVGNDCNNDAAATRRICIYCNTTQFSGRLCANCGAPDDNKREPIAMAPFGVYLS